MRRRHHASALVPAIEQHRRAFRVKLKAKRSGRRARGDPRKPVGIRLSTGSFPTGLLLEEDLERSKGISNRGCARCGWIHGVAGGGLTGGIRACAQTVQAPLIQSVYLWSDLAVWIVLSKIPGFIPCSTQRCAQPNRVTKDACDAKVFSDKPARRRENRPGSRRIRAMGRARLCRKTTPARRRDRPGPVLEETDSVLGTLPDPGGELFDVIENLTPRSHFLLDLALGVHHRGVVAAEGLADPRQ